MARGTGDDGPHPVDRHVGRRVCKKRIERGYNQSQLGKALGLTFQQVQKYEKGTNRISSSKLWDISKFLKVDVGCFFEGLPDGVPASSRDPGTDGDHTRVTRASLEIASLAPQLSGPRQKVVLDLIRLLAD